MTPSTRTWLHGLIAALIGGGASAVAAGITVPIIAPGSFNYGNQVGATLQLAAVLFVVNATISVAAYLKQSPLPAIDGAIQQIVTVSQTPAGDVKVQSTAQNVSHLPSPSAAPIDEVLANRETAEAEILRLRAALNIKPETDSKS